jgi:hypothetical protein
MLMKCKNCTATFSDFDDLRFHFQTAHQRIAHKIDTWLGKSDNKLAWLEMITTQGMIGNRERLPGKQVAGRLDFPHSVVEELEELTGKGGDIYES